MCDIINVKEGGQLFGGLTLCRTIKNILLNFIDYLQVKRQGAYMICSVVWLGIVKGFSAGTVSIKFAMTKQVVSVENKEKLLKR